MLNIFKTSLFANVTYILILYLLSNNSIIRADIFIANILILIVFYFVLFKQFNDGSYETNKLSITVLLFNFFAITIYLLLFLIHTNTLFEFYAFDSLQYDSYAKELNKDGIGSIIVKTISGYRSFDFDDMGFTVYLSLVYSIIESKLLVNFLNLILLILTANLLFKISKLFLSHKGAYFVAIIYTMSSYTSQMAATGLKETLMIYLIILCYYTFLKYLFNGNVFQLFLSLIIPLFLLFFRVPITIFIYISFGSLYLIPKDITIKKIIIFLIFLIITIFSLQQLLPYLQQYFVSYNDLVITRTGLEGHRGTSPFFITFLSFIVGFFGPFPTFLPRIAYESLSVDSTGLMLKVMFSFPFVFGIWYILRKRVVYMIPFVVFILLDMLSISFLWQSFELRKVLPHIPFVFIIAIYYLELNKDKLKKINMLNIILLLNVFLWNYLRF